MRILLPIFLTLVSVSLLKAQPALPPGLGGEDKPDSPPLPPGLSIGSAQKEEKDIAPSRPSLNLSGSLELRSGMRLQNDPVSEDSTLNELRLQLQNRGQLGDWNYRLTGDFLYDDEAENRGINFRSGEGWFDLREATLAGQLNASLDLKLGRQTTTWGTGDLLFINDLFPKDWQSFLLGRDEEYLKAPGNAARLNFFSEAINLDVVFSPRFDPDRFITGERLSYFDPGSDDLVGKNQVVNPRHPSAHEFALRAHRLIGSAEVAFYFYDGFWKSPAGQSADGRAIFPSLQVTGASWRQPALDGILYSEIGYYNSKDDSSGLDPSIRNSETRWLAGYERELGENLTGSFQYYAEHRSHQHAFADGFPDGASVPDRTRHLLTMRLTKLALMQNLRLSLFTFWSPSDEDFYVRPQFQYQYDDHWTFGGGMNVFEGTETSTFFGQFENNSNVYLFGRYGF